MTIRTTDCVECGESVAYGRLSCPSCGALLASVTGARRPAVRIDEVTVAPATHLEPASPTGFAPTAVAAAHREPSRPVEAIQSPLPLEATSAPAQRSMPAPADVPPIAPPPAAARMPVAASATAPAPVATKPAASSRPSTAKSAKTATTATQPFADLEPSTAVRSVGASVTPPYMKRGKPSAPTATSPRPAVIPLVELSAVAAPAPTPWTPLVEPQAMLIGRPYLRHLAPDPDEEADPAPPPSAYRPPTMALATAGTAIASTSSWSVGTGDIVAGVASTDDVDAESTPSNRPVLDAARFNEIAGWFVIVGATMSVLGFLLPWSRIVIGSGGNGGYFDTWGLAGPTHPVIFLGLLGILALAVLRTPVPAWIVSSAASLGLGGLLVGLTWPYLFGSLGAQIGVTVTALGGIALLIGGAVATWAIRHEAAHAPV